MSLVEKMLDNAIVTGRKVTRTEYPLFANIPVIKAEPNPKFFRPWMFYTERPSKHKGRKTLHLDIYKPDEIHKLFDDFISKIYKDAYGPGMKVDSDFVARLCHDTLAYLYHHELFHPLFCPDSETDEALMDKAFYEAISEAEPRLSRPQVEMKVANVRNAGCDQVIDTAFFSKANYDNHIGKRLETVISESMIPLNEAKYISGSVIPIFDLIEIETKKDDFESMFYPLSRGVYAMLFITDNKLRTAAYDYIKRKCEKKMKPAMFDKTIKDAIKGFAKELDEHELQFSRINTASFYGKVDNFVDNYKTANDDENHEAIINSVSNLLLSKQTRYSSIKGFIKELSQYISLTDEEPRHGTNNQWLALTNGSEGKVKNLLSNAEQVLINLSNVLPPGEAAQLLMETANMGLPNIKGAPADTNRQLNTLATDEYYKRNSKEMFIKSPKHEAIKVDLGKKEIYTYVGTRILLPQDIINLNLERIIQFQQETGITQLFELSPTQFRFDEYEKEEIDDFDYTFQTTGINLPDNLIFHVDSSGSMGSTNYVGTGWKYDILMHVCYGILKTMFAASKEMKKDINVITANFSRGTITSPASKLVDMYNGLDNETKKVLTGFQNGGTVYSPEAFKDIKSKQKPGKTVHVWITDGEIEEHSQPGTLRGIENAIKDKDVSFLYFEIGGASEFGQKIANLSTDNPHVKYYPNVKIEDIGTEALDVLIQYS